jgi:3-oxoacyl-[acyl-carrier protein] reductase
MRLKDKVALVTGSSRGIGKAIATAFAAEGARIVVNFPSQADAKDADDVVRGIARLGGEALAIRGDVAIGDDVQRLFKDTVNRYGRLDILVNNAGFTRPALLLEMTEEEWDRVLNVHLKGAFLCSQAAARHMKTQGGGKIINVTSVAGLLGTIGQINYSAAKGGLVSLTKSTARELARYNICANAVSLGVVNTDMTTRIRTDPELKKVYLDRILLKRFAETDEIAPAFLFLASDDSKYITGQVLCVDGGYGLT